MNTVEKNIISLLDGLKDDISQQWYNESCARLKFFSKDEILQLCKRKIDIVSNSLLENNENEIMDWAKQMGSLFADKQVSLSDLFMNFKVFRSIMWSNLKKNVTIPRSPQDDYGITLNQALDDLYYWCTVYYDQNVNDKLKNNQYTIRTLQKDQKQKELEIRQLHEQRLEVMGQLAAGMAHEIRNPLTSIKGFLQLIHKEHSHPEKVNSYFTIISNEFDRLHLLLNHFLTLTKPKGSIEIHKGPLSLNKVLDKIMEFIQFEVIYRSIDFSTEIEQDLQEIEGNESELEQVLLNLLKNAFDAVHNHQDKKVMLTAHNQGTDRVLITVFNTGDTIPPEKLQNLFQPFFSTKPSGTGLGLSICKQIIESIGGKISIQSELHVGTTVTVDIPVSIPNH